MILNHRGFTLGEVLASLIALGIIALTVQSLMLVANNFLSQQSSAMSSMQERTFFSKMICHKFGRPVFVEQNLSRSFKYNPDTQTYVKKADARPNPEQNPATLSVPLLNTHSQSLSSLNVNDHPAVQIFFGGSDFALDNTPDDFTDNKVFIAHINDNAAINATQIDNASGSHTYYSQFYDIYADDHTLPTFMVKGEGDRCLGKISDGFIYASRCIKNHQNTTPQRNVPGSFIEIEGDSPKYSIIDRSDDEDMSDGEVLATALYVLEQKWRPFYFPDQEKAKNKVICCDISQFSVGSPPHEIKLVTNTPPQEPTIPSNCANLETYTPIIYVIKISSDSGGRSVEDLIPENKSLEGYVQADISGTNSVLRNNSACSSATHVIDWNAQDSSGVKCADEIVKNYCRTLGKRLVHPVKFENVEELPLVKKDRVNTWAYGFIAPSFGGQNMHKEFKILSIENKCHTSLPVGLCGKAVPGLDLADPLNKIENKSVAEYFISRVSHCPFSYVTMDSSAGTLPLGLDRVE